LSLPRIHMCNQRPGARLKGLRFVMACVLVLAPMHTAPVAWLRSSVCPLLKIPPPPPHTPLLAGYLYLNSQRQQQQQQGQGRQPAHGGAGGISGFMMQQAQGLTGSAAAAGSRPGQGQSGGAHGNSSSGSAFQGRSYKLGSSS
jgi:hypothetical protein